LSEETKQKLSQSVKNFYANKNKQTVGYMED